MQQIFSPETIFTTGSGQRITLSNIVPKIKEYLGDCEEYTIDVGTDSHTTDKTKVITVIMVHKGHSGGIFFYKTTWYDKMHILRDKIYTETRLSIECAQLLIDLLLEEDVLYDINIHCDLGKYGKTKELIKETVAYVSAYGFTCMIKPYSVAASAIADKYSK
jgi:predicted RNase H-related nuclease YkuK (DUF458 family)